MGKRWCTEIERRSMNTKTHLKWVVFVLKTDILLQGSKLATYKEQKEKKKTLGGYTIVTLPLSPLTTSPSLHFITTR